MQWLLRRRRAAHDARQEPHGADHQARAPRRLQSLKSPAVAQPGPAGHGRYALCRQLHAAWWRGADHSLPQRRHTGSRQPPARRRATDQPRPAGAAANGQLNTRIPTLQGSHNSTENHKGIGICSYIRTARCSDKLFPLPRQAGRSLGVTQPVPLHCAAKLHRLPCPPFCR